MIHDWLNHNFGMVQILGRFVMTEFFIERREEEGDYAIRRRGSKKANEVCDTKAKRLRKHRKLTLVQPFL
jgi:hypothetical protein